MRREPGHDTGRNALRHALRRDLAMAMKAREPDAVAALRTAIAAIDNAEAVPAPEARQAATGSHIAGARAGLGAAEAARRELDESDQRAILRDQIAGYTAEADRYEALGQPAAAARLRSQAQLLSGYLHLPALTCTYLHLPALGLRRGRDGAAKPIPDADAKRRPARRPSSVTPLGRKFLNLPILPSVHQDRGNSASGGKKARIYRVFFPRDEKFPRSFLPRCDVRVQREPRGP